MVTYNGQEVQPGQVIVVPTRIPGGRYKKGELAKAQYLSRKGKKITKTNKGEVVMPEEEYEEQEQLDPNRPNVIVLGYPEIDQATARQISDFARRENSRVSITRTDGGYKVTTQPKRTEKETKIIPIIAYENPPSEVLYGQRMNVDPYSKITGAIGVSAAGGLGKTFKVENKTLVINDKNNRMGNNRNDMGNSNNLLSSSKKEETIPAGFERRLNRISAREEKFKNYLETSPGIDRVKGVASFLTFNNKVGSEVLSGIMLSPIYLGAAIPMATEKTLAFGEATFYKGSRRLILPELKRTGTEVISTTLNPTTKEGRITYITAGVGAFGIFNPTNPLTRASTKTVYGSKYVPVEKLNIDFVEANTVPTRLNELMSLQGKEVSTVHVTTVKLPSEFVTVAKPEGAGGFRRSYGLFNFYKSSPDVKSVDVPRAYLGYAGIKSGKALEQSSDGFIFGKPSVNVLVGKDYVSSSLTKGSVEDINAWQIKQSGKTFVPAENIKGVSMEGQLVSPSKYENIKGYGDSVGSKIVLDRTNAKFTYYGQEKSGLFGLIKYKKYYKFNIIESKTFPVKSVDIVKLGKSELLDLEKYNKKYERSASSRSVSDSKLPRSGFYSLINDKGSISSSSRGSGLVSSVSYSSIFFSNSFSKSKSSSSKSYNKSLSRSISSSYSRSKTSLGYSFSSSESFSRSSSFNPSYSTSISSYSFTPGYGTSYSLTPRVPPNIPPKLFPLKYPSYSKKSVRNKWSSKVSNVKLGDSGLYVLPDLFNVEITESKYAFTTGEQAIAPRLTGKIKLQAFAAFKGYSPGFINTEQQRRGKIKI
jgi:hypothetical protein